MTRDFKVHPSVNGAPLMLRDEHVTYQSFFRTGELSVLAGEGRFTFPRSGAITGWSASVATAPSGSSLTLRLNLGGVELDTGSIGAGSNFMAQRTLDEPVDVGDFVTVDITQVGSSTPGDFLTVVMAWKPI